MISPDKWLVVNNRLKHAKVAEILSGINSGAGSNLPYPYYSDLPYGREEWMVGEVAGELERLGWKVSISKWYGWDGYEALTKITISLPEPEPEPENKWSIKYWVHKFIG